MDFHIRHYEEYVPPEYPGATSSMSLCSCVFSLTLHPPYARRLEKERGQDGSSRIKLSATCSMRIPKDISRFRVTCAPLNMLTTSSCLLRILVASSLSSYRVPYTIRSIGEARFSAISLRIRFSLSLLLSLHVTRSHTFPLRFSVHGA